MLTLSEAKAHGEELLNRYSNLHKLQDKMDEMIFMEWKNKPENKNLKFTISPEPRNEFLGAMRLLTATDPIINVPSDKNDRASIEKADLIERLCNAVIYQSGRIMQKPVHYDLVSSLLRYGQFHLAIIDTDDLLNLAQKSNKNMSKAARKRYEHINKATPYLLEPLDPKCGSAEFDEYGLRAYYRQTSVTYAYLFGKFGRLPEWEQRAPTDTTTYHDYWDLDVHYAWVEGMDEPLIGGKHNMPCIPIVVQGGEGSRLNEEPEKQFQPFLYTIEKGELWDRHNLQLSALFTNLFAVASNATFIHKQAVPGETEMEVDWSVPGGILHLGPGEDFQPAEFNVFNKDTLYSMDLLNKMMEESSIYKQTLGGPTVANQAYSTVALLSQSGRLPLVATQHTGGWGIGTAFELMFQMIRDSGKKRTALSKEGKLEIDPIEIPENLIIDVSLDMSLPQDKLQQANTAAMMVDKSLASVSWIRENILNIGQSKDMDKQITEEMFERQMTQEYFTKAMETEIRKQIAAEMEAQAQQAQQAQQQQMAMMQQQAAQQAQAVQQQSMESQQMAAYVQELQRRLAEQQAGSAAPGSLERLAGMTAGAAAPNQQFNPAMGGLSQITTGAIPGLGEQPIPATGEAQEAQEG